MRRKIFKRLVWLLVILFILMNVVASLHAYNFTHFSNLNIAKTKETDKLSFLTKVKILTMGINNPRPVDVEKPTQKFETINIQSNKLLECWSIKRDGSKGTVILFHGYSGNKSTMIDKSDEFVKLGYNMLLVDFMGSGGSEGNETTVGFKEGEEVKDCYNYLVKQGEKKIYLFGTSMGAVAVIKSINDYHINPTGIIIECPFGSMLKTTSARFRMLGVPPFPMADLLVFWGGIENGFWGFGFNPAEYAKEVKCPTLLLYGDQDKRVSRREIDDIYSNLLGAKQLKTFPQAAHEDYLIKYKQQWISDVEDFLKTISK